MIRPKKVPLDLTRQVQEELFSFDRSKENFYYLCSVFLVFPDKTDINGYITPLVVRQEVFFFSIFGYSLVIILSLVDLCIKQLYFPI